MKWIRYIFILVFIGLLYFPLINNSRHFITKTYEGIIPTAPKLAINHLDPFPKLYENFFDKRLELKPWLVSLNSKLKIKALGVAPNPDKVIMGKSGWLFLGGNKIAEYQGTNLFTNNELKKIKDRLDARAIRAKEKFGSKLYFAIIPLKHAVYPEYLPLFVRKVKEITRADQLFSYLGNDSLITMIDVKEDLINAKSSHLLYYKTDNHWNEIGGNIAYKKIASVLHKDFPAINPTGTDLMIMDSSQNAGGGEAIMLNAEDWYHELKYDYSPGPQCKAKDAQRRGYRPPDGFPYPWDYENVRITSDSTLPDALIFRDSFCDALLPFLAENFNRSVFIFDAWQYKANYDMVDAEKPKVILYIAIESELDALLKYE